MKRFLQVVSSGLFCIAAVAGLFTAVFVIQELGGQKYSTLTEPEQLMYRTCAVLFVACIAIAVPLRLKHDNMKMYAQSDGSISSTAQAQNPLPRLQRESVTPMMIAIYGSTVNGGKPRGIALDSADRIMRSYQTPEFEVLWMDVWSAAHARDSTVPVPQAPPYWVQDEVSGEWVPITVMAFWGKADRLAVTRHESTDEDRIRTMIKDDNFVVHISAINRTFKFL